MKHLLLLAGSLVLALGFVQPRNEAKPIGMRTVKLSLAHGEVWQTFYDDGGLASFEERAKNAAGKLVRNGRHLEFYPDGSIMIERSYCDDRPNGTWTSYYASGKKMGESEYRRGVRHGIGKFWNPEGELAGLSRYREGRRIAPWLMRSRGAPRFTDETVACFLEEYGDVR